MTALIPVSSVLFLDLCSLFLVSNIYQVKQIQRSFAKGKDKMSEKEKFKMLLSKLNNENTSTSSTKRNLHEFLNKIRDERKCKNLLLELEKIFQEENNIISRHDLTSKLGEFVKSIHVGTLQVNNLLFVIKGATKL